jgi:hypothetical protein
VADTRRHPQGPLRFADLIRFEIKDEAAIFWDKTRLEKVAPRSDDQDFICRDFDRTDAVASSELSTSRAAHLIMDRNETTEKEMRLWPNDWYPGRRIQLPTVEGLRDRGLV